jgi:hypothetical protein
MVWASLIKSIVSLWSALVGYFRDKRLIDLGAKEAELEGRKAIDETNANIDIKRNDVELRKSTRKKYTRKP